MTGDTPRSVGETDPVRVLLVDDQELVRSLVLIEPVLFALVADTPEHRALAQALGELAADPARGLVYGNRGCLHDANGRIRRRYDVLLTLCRRILLILIVRAGIIRIGSARRDVDMRAVLRFGFKPLYRQAHRRFAAVVIDLGLGRTALGYALVIGDGGGTLGVGSELAGT